MLNAINKLISVNAIEASHTSPATKNVDRTKSGTPKTTRQANAMATEECLMSTLVPSSYLLGTQIVVFSGANLAQLPSHCTHLSMLTSIREPEPLESITVPQHCRGRINYLFAYSRYSIPCAIRIAVASGISPTVEIKYCFSSIV